MQRSAETLAALRKAIASCELHERSGTTALGHICADTVLQGGLRNGALHEVYAGDASQCGSATGFVSGFAARLSPHKEIAWITTDYCSTEYGALSASGLKDIGVDPSRILLLRLANGNDALRAMADVLACASIGAAVFESEGRVKTLSLNASRRLSLAAAQRGIPAILLRIAAKPEASAAETRWLVHAAASPPLDPEGDFGAPHFGVQLLRNRHGENGEWRIGWNCNDGLFGSTEDWKRAADIVRMAAAASDRPASAQAAG